MSRSGRSAGGTSTTPITPSASASRNSPKSSRPRAAASSTSANSRFAARQRAAAAVGAARRHAGDAVGLDHVARHAWSRNSACWISPSSSAPRSRPTLWPCGAFGKAMIDTLPQRGLIGLGYWGLGFRNVTNSKHPIAKLEDFSGLKLRVIPNPVYLESFSAFKANPIPMAFGELYTALEPARSTARKIPTPSSSPTSSLKFRSTSRPPTIPSRRTSSSSARSSGTSFRPSSSA